MSDSNVANLPPTERLTPRKRYRAQIRDEIKQVALRQLAESGPSGISMNAIGKQLGVSGPALYRYFAGRADLLAELVIDAYTDLAAAARNAIPATSSRTQRARFETCALAYRSWALAQPHRYQLLFSPPLPGFDANAERLIDSAQALMELLIEVLPPHSSSPKPPQALATQAAQWMQKRDIHSDTVTALRAVQTWSRLHGFISLEIAGNYASMGLDPDILFQLELAALTT
jgi:AcrR family transcriptional regulator